MKNIIRALVGSFIVMFGLSALFHLTVADSIYPANFMTGPAGGPLVVPNLVPIAAGYLVLSTIMVFIYTRWNEKGDDLMKGLKFGAVIGTLLALPMGLIFISVVNYPPLAVVIDTIWAIIEQGLGGIAIAFLMKMK